MAVLADASGPTPTKDEALLVEAEIADLLHVFAEHRHVEAILALDELGAGLDLLSEAVRAEVIGRGEGVDRRAQKHLGRRRQLAAGQELSIVAHGAHGFQQRHAVEVEDRLGARLVAGLHAVAGQAHDVGDAHGGSAQHVALDGDAVLVAAGDLHDRRIAHAGQKRADADEDMWQLAPEASTALMPSTQPSKDCGALVDVLADRRCPAG